MQTPKIATRAAQLQGLPLNLLTKDHLEDYTDVVLWVVGAEPKQALIFTTVKLLATERTGFVVVVGNGGSIHI